MLNYGQLTEKHHAMLFALMAREVIQRFGVENGQTTVRRIVRRYGEQRGYRMALRALRDGRPLTMQTFLVYKEWSSMSGEGVSRSFEESENVHSVVINCPWNNTWLEADLLPYGSLYCMEVDQALVRGFNPSLVIEVKSTLSNNEDRCEFIYHHAVALNPEDNIHPILDPIMPWDYHCGHLYFICLEELTEKFGEAGVQAARDALDAFCYCFGNELVERIISYQGQRFDRLPA